MSYPLVREHMATTLHTLTPKMDIREAIPLLLDNAISGAPVVDAQTGALVGVLSELDCLKLMTTSSDIPEGHVEDYMSRDVETISPDMDVYWAAGKFLGSRFRRFPVVEDGKLIGQLSRRDVLRVIQINLERERIKATA